jgi:hypothetical protein
LKGNLRPIGIDSQILRFDQDILASNFWMLDFKLAIEVAINMHLITALSMFEIFNRMESLELNYNVRQNRQFYRSLSILKNWISVLFLGSAKPLFSNAVKSISLNIDRRLHFLVKRVSFLCRLLFTIII